MYWVINQIDSIFPLQDRCGATVRCFIYLLVWQMPVIYMFLGRTGAVSMFIGIQRLVFRFLILIFVVVVIPSLMIDLIVSPIFKSIFALVGKVLNDSDLVIRVCRWALVGIYEVIVAGQFLLKRHAYQGFHFQMLITGKDLQLGHDAPITSMADDMFNRGPFVRMLSDAISRAQVCNNAEYIGVFAPWGAGKTSVLNLLKRELSNKNVATGCRNGICVDFNPWMFKSASEALVVFLRKLADTLLRCGEIKAADAFRSYAHLLRWRKIEVRGGFLGELIDLFRQAFFSFVHSDEKTIKKVRIALRDVKSRIVVSVDDLERMPANDVREIIAFFKSNFDLPNIVVLYLSDREHLFRAIEQVYVPDRRVETANLGDEYLGKIMPHQFNLPDIPKEALIKYFSSQLQKLAKDVVMPKYNCQTDDGEGFDTVCDFVRTIRDVKMLLNKIWEEIALHKNSTASGALNLHLGDLVALTTIRIWATKVYDELPGFIDKMSVRLAGKDASNKIGMSSEEIDAWVSEREIKNEIKVVVRKFLEKRLGLKLVGDVGGTRSYILSGHTDSTKRFECRLSSPDYWRLYFEDFSNVNHISLAVVMDFERQIESGAVPEKLLTTAITDGTLAKLLYTLEGQSEYSSVTATETYFKTLLWLANQKFDDRYFSIPDENRLGYIRSFDYNVYTSIARCIKQYVDRYNGMDFVRMGERMVRPSGAFPEAAAQILFRATLEVPSVFLIWQFIAWDSNYHGNTTMRYPGQLFSHEDYDRLEDCYLDHIEQMEKDGKLFESVVFFDLMRAWTLILKRRNLVSKRDLMCKLLLNDLSDLGNVRKFLPFIMESAVFFEAMFLGPSKFLGVSVKGVKERFNEDVIGKVNATLHANAITDYDLKMVKYALEYVVQNKLDAEKCKYENQWAYVQNKLGIRQSGKNTFVE